MKRMISHRTEIGMTIGDFCFVKLMYKTSENLKKSIKVSFCSAANVAKAYVMICIFIPHRKIFPEGDIGLNSVCPSVCMAKYLENHYLKCHQISYMSSSGWCLVNPKKVFWKNSKWPTGSHFRYSYVNWYILKTIQPILKKFSTHIALIRSFKVNISFFWKIQYGRQFCRFREFLNYDVQYLRKYSTNFIEIWHTYSTHREH